MQLASWFTGVFSFIENNSSSTEPSDVSVTRKRKTGSDRNAPWKRKGVSESGYGGMGPRKRKASRDEEVSRKRTSWHELSEDVVRVKRINRKVTQNGDGPGKRQRVSNLDQRHEDKMPWDSSEEISRQEFEAKYKQLSIVSELPGRVAPAFGSRPSATSLSGAAPASPLANLSQSFTLWTLSSLPPTATLPPPIVPPIPSLSPLKIQGIFSWKYQ